MFSKDGVRDSYRQVLQTLESLNLETLNKNTIWLLTFYEPGNTFTVYSDEEQGIKEFSFDIIPRILTKKMD
jgi:uncharacterized circularly permuted ATP-grasp superfamily protein